MAAREQEAMTVLVTGGMGFIGSHFVRHLVANFPGVTVINLDKLTYAGNPANLADLKDDPAHIFMKGDILDTGLLAALFSERRIDAVVHLAAESHVDRSILAPKGFIDTNVSGTLNLLWAALESWESRGQMASARFIHVSTDEVYGSLGPEDPPAKEDAGFAPNSPYAASKAAGDHLARSFNKTYGLPVVITNSTNNYGPFQFPEKLIPLSINNIRNNNPVPIYGKGENVRDWLYVEDHAEAIDRVFHQGRNGETYNIGGNNEWKNIDLIKLLCGIMDDRLKRSPGTSAGLIEFVKDRAGHDLRYAIDAGKIKEDLGWEPSVSFEEGLAMTVDWYLDNEEWLNNVLSGDYAKYYDLQYKKR